MPLKAAAEARANNVRVVRALCRQEASGTVPAQALLGAWLCNI